MYIFIHTHTHTHTHKTRTQTAEQCGESLGERWAEGGDGGRGRKWGRAETLLGATGKRRSAQMTLRCVVHLKPVWFCEQMSP